MASNSDDDSSNPNLLLLTLLPQSKDDDFSPDLLNPQQHQQPSEQTHRLIHRQTLTTRSLPSQDLEIGSGTSLACICSSPPSSGPHVTLTDLPHVLPNLRFNAEANADAIAALGGSAGVRQLIWGDEVDQLPVSTRFDVVMASDVVYYGHLVDPLLKTLSWLVKGEVVFVMAHLRRWKKTDAVFFRKARKLFEVVALHSDPPLPASRVGVVVYRFVAKKKAVVVC
ncbi:protein N-lysine methyltransferase METTL21A-like [Asparagus officinalis]|uniref:protein N-lysine methyltransferase METTL21A-like n=1 Tax=Asparagus officinalis TaxID=4686 RepID=UPI00098E022A|nr:protein N-lysine methyltransferase METTL21A-like [Asparagus officinalis]